MITLFHCTPISNVDSILQHGLIPQIGERSVQLSEEEGIFLFTTYKDCETALLQWLGEEFEDLDEELVTLKVELPVHFLLEETTEWERVSRVLIEPKYISFYKNEG